MTTYAEILEAADTGMLITVIPVRDEDGDRDLDVMGWILHDKTAERAWTDSSYGLGIALAIMPARRRVLADCGFTFA